MTLPAACLVLVSLVPWLATPAARLASVADGIDPDAAARAFAEARAASERDDGALWGEALYGRMLFVHPASWTMIANRADPDGVLEEVADGVFAGPIADGIGIANTAQDWQGVSWTTVIWPLPGAERDRVRLLVHELVHRVQPSFGTCAFPAAANVHLDTGGGRAWLRLEWRALAAALRATDADARRGAVADALVFRAARHAVYPDAHDAEVALESNEGVCEYTGYVLAEPADVRAGAVAARLSGSERADRHARSFAYVSGPACGVLLDLADAARGGGASWRDGFAGTVDFGARLAAAYDVTLPDDPVARAKQRLAVYDGEQVLLEESDRERARQARIARYRERFVDGPVLELSATPSVSFTFDPYREENVPDLGQVYDTITATDAWGRLAVSSGGALLLRDGDGRVSAFRVPAPADAAASAATLHGDGWTLELADGWSLAPGARAGDVAVTRRDG